MQETRKKIQEILDIIENDERRDRSNELSMEQVKEILLGRSSSFEMKQSRSEDCLLRLYQMRENAQLNYYHQLPDETSFLVKVSNFIKRAVRKMIRPIMLPVTDAQSRYNLEVQQVLYELDKRMEELSEEQKALRQLVLTMSRDLREDRERDEE